MDLNAAIEKLVDDRVRQLLAEHACRCRHQPLRELPVRGDTGDLAAITGHVWLTTAEAAAYTRKSQVTIRQCATAGTLHSTQGAAAVAGGTASSGSTSGSRRRYVVVPATSSTTADAARGVATSGPPRPSGPTDR